MSFTNLYVSTTGTTTPYTAATTPGNAKSQATMVSILSSGVSLAGYVFNILNGTYSFGSSSLTISSFGTSTSPLVIRGYNTTIGDGYQGRTSGWGSLVTTSMPTWQWTNSVLVLSGAFVILEALKITNTVANFSTMVTISGADSFLKSCLINTNHLTNGISITTGGSSGIQDCDIIATSATNGVTVSGAGGCYALGCRVIAGTNCFNLGQFSITLFNNLLYGGSIGVLVGNNSTVALYNNTIAGFSSHAIDVTGASNLIQIFGNMITDNSGYAINSASGKLVFHGNNYCRNNNPSGSYVDFNGVSDLLSYQDSGVYGNVHQANGTAFGDYTAKTSGNYTIAATSPALTMNSAGLTYGAQPFKTLPGCFGNVNSGGSGGGVPLIGDGLVY